MSYTTFAYSTNKTAVHVSLESLRSLLANQKFADGNKKSPSFISLKDVHKANAKAGIKYSVKVTNTGKVDSDDVVLGFMTPPGAGESGVPLQTLFGFERVHVPAGKTVEVYLYPDVTTFSIVDERGVRNVLPGEYKVHFGVRETAVHDMGYAEMRVVAV